MLLTYFFLCLRISALFAILSNSFVPNVSHTIGEECYRPCSEDTERVCYFKFVLEHYHAMGPACGECATGRMIDCFNLHCLTADGVEKGVMSINRKIPGPELHVCKGDLVVVDVINRMAGTSTALHWHGIHQRETPYMDGVPYVTQCPINYATSFRYTFRASEVGTHFYHSHAGHHKVNGHYGALIVRHGKEPHSNLYDYDLKEHTMIISDWMHYTAEMFAAGLPTRKPGPLPVNVLINGKGTFFDKDEGETTKSPIQVYKVQDGKKYRFRLIDGAALECPLQIQVQGHNLTVIGTDGNDIQPISVDTLITAAGERYDFIIEANQKLGTYCIKIKLLGECDEDGGIEQYGVLAYSNNTELTIEENIEYAKVATNCRKIGNELISVSFLNHPNMTCNDPSNKHHCPTDLTSLNVEESLLNATVDQRLFLGFDNYDVAFNDIFQENHYSHFLSDGEGLIQAAINNISFTLPSFSILTQPDELTDDMFCNEDNLPKHCKLEICTCTHRIKIKLNSVVEMVLIDDRDKIGPENHPFHMHGYTLTVTEMGQDKKQRMTIPLYKHLKREDKLPILFSKSDAVLKDTINIPSNGYAVVRFRADNPGFWLLHCHFEWHMTMGMSLIVQIGEPSDFVNVPKGFPTCRDYTPEL